MNSVSGLLLDEAGNITQVNVARPSSGGLVILAELLGCQDWQVACIQLDQWIHLWFADTKGLKDNGSAAQLIEQLGTPRRVAGKCLLVGTEPSGWKMVSLTAEQEATIRQALQN